MLDSPIFSRSHFSRAPLCPLLVSRERWMYLIEGQNVSDLDLRISKSKQMLGIDFNTAVVGPSRIIRDRFLFLNVKAVSCEGLLCWVLHDHPDADYIFICNPITGEYASLSPLPMDQNNFYVFIGMGFCRSTKKFELLRMSGRVENDDDDDDDDDDDEVSLIWWPEVRSVGDRCWRRVGDGTFKLGFEGGISQVIYVNGAIYWSYDEDSSICSFHFDRAIFQVMPLPKMLETHNSASKPMSLGVLANSLCVSIFSPIDERVELWIMEDDGDSQVQWNKLCDVEIQTTYLKISAVVWPRAQYKAIKYLDGGEILMHDWGGQFLIYDPISKEGRELCVLQDSFLEVVPHVPCLVRLMEALNVDEEGVKVMKEEANGKFWWVK